MRMSYAPALLGWVLFLAGCGNAGPTAMPPSVSSSGQVVPPTATGGPPGSGDAQVTTISIKTVDYDGVVAAVERHRGKVVVMDAWATWCAPCVKEFPNLVKLHKKYGSEKLACVSLSFNDGSVTDDPEDGMQAATKFLSEQKATFENLLTANQDVGDEIYRKLDFPSIPAVLVYDQEGKLSKLFMESGDKNAPPLYEQVEELVKELLAGKEE